MTNKLGKRFKEIREEYIMTELLFHDARNLKEAYDLLEQYGKKAQILAGGTDVMVRINRKLVNPKALVYIGNCGLNYIRSEGTNIVIGATTPFAEIVSSELIKKKIPLLTEAACLIGGPAIRNAGTIGGNLSNASPAADSSTPLLALRASLKLASKNGERTIPVEEFFTGPGQTVLEPGELLKEVIIPFPEAGTKWAYRKIGRRRAETLSVIAGAFSMRLGGGKCTDGRLALCAVAPTPILAKKASSLINGKQLDASLIEHVAKIAAEETNPIDDVRGTAWYRHHATEAIVKNLLEELMK